MDTNANVVDQVAQIDLSASLTPLPPLANSAPSSNGTAAMTAIPIDPEIFNEDAQSSDDNWSSSSSCNEEADEESVLTFDTAESITYVSGKGHTAFFVSKNSKSPFERASGELSWRMDPKENFSDYTLVVRSNDNEEESRYSVHRAILAFGQCRCDYFAKLFRSSFCENQNAMSHFIFPSKIAAFFPDFLDVLYNRQYVQNITIHNVAALRFLSFYFCSYGLSSEISEQIKWAMRDIVDPDVCRYALHDMSIYVKMLCEEPEIDDTKDLLASAVDVFVKILSQYGKFFSDDGEKDVWGRSKSEYEITFRKESREGLTAIVYNMSPEVLLAVLLKATANLTNRYRIFESRSTFPFCKIVLMYLRDNKDVDRWSFERIVLCLLDFLQRSKVSALSLIKRIFDIGDEIGKATPFVRSILDSAKSCYEEVESHDGENITGDSLLLRVVIEGNLEGYPTSPEEFDLSFSSFTVVELKKAIYQKMGLLPNLQVISTSSNIDDEVSDSSRIDEITWRGGRSGHRMIYLHSRPMPAPIGQRSNKI